MKLICILGLKLNGAEVVVKPSFSTSDLSFLVMGCTIWSMCHCYWNEGHANGMWRAFSNAIAQGLKFVWFLVTGCHVLLLFGAFCWFNDQLDNRCNELMCLLIIFCHAGVTGTPGISMNSTVRALNSYLACFLTISVSVTPTQTPISYLFKLYRKYSKLTSGFDKNF